MAKKLIQLPKHPSGMTDEELQAALAGANGSEIIRGLIVAGAGVIRRGAE
jgi:hypothetical protein